MTETARSAGAIGSSPIIPNYLIEHKDEYFYKSILDFGCGKTGRHVSLLDSHGFAVWGEDLALTYSEDLVDSNPVWLHRPGKKYDLVYANSVINIQANLKDAFEVIHTLWLRANPGGMVMFTVSKNPWHLEGASPSAFRSLLTRLEAKFTMKELALDRSLRFTPIKRKKDPSSWIWVFHKPKL